MGVVSKKHAHGAEAPDFNSGKAAVGTGPHRFVEWVKGDRVVFEANPDYWRGKPPTTKAVFKPIKSSPSRVAALLARDVDFIDYVPTTDIKKLSQTPGIHLAQAPSCRVIFLFLDQSLEAIAQMLTKIGLKIAVQAMPKSVYFSRMAKLEFSFGMVADCSSTGDATWPLKGYFHTRDTGLGLGLNDMSRYGNGRLDAIIVEALSTIDNVKREKLYHEAMGIAMRDVSHIPLHYQVNAWAMREGVSYKARADEKTLAFFLVK